MDGWSGRCMAATGTAQSGPAFCGYRERGADANGRPCCGRHLGKVEWQDWSDRSVYPHGPGDNPMTGRWHFTHGPARPEGGR